MFWKMFKRAPLNERKTGVKQRKDTKPADSIDEHLKRRRSAE